MSFIDHGDLVLIDEALCYLKYQLDLFVNEQNIGKKYSTEVFTNICEEIKPIYEIRGVFKESIEKKVDFNYTKPFHEYFPKDSIEIMKYALKKYKEDLSKLKGEFDSKFSGSPVKLRKIDEKMKKIEQILGFSIFQ